MLSVYDNIILLFFILLTAGNLRFSRLNAVVLHYQIKAQREAFYQLYEIVLIHKAETHSMCFFLFEQMCPPEYSQYINMWQMKCSSEEIKEVISTGLCSFILHPQYYFLFSIFTYPHPFYWMVGALAWLIPVKIFHWCLVTMKMSSLDTEVMATALHPVAICALCVLHHFEIRLVQSIDSSMLPFNRPSVSFWDLPIARLYGFP